MDDQKAIDQLKKGDISGLEALVRKYQLQAIRAANLITHDLGLAEDIVQAAFLRSFERIDQFETGSSFKPWFLQIVVNDAIKAAQRTKKVFSLSLEEEEPNLSDLLTDPAPGPEELLEAGETRQAIWDALAKISPAQRATIVLHYYLGLKEVEVAAQLECPTGTVKSRLHKARVHLRRLLSAKL